MKKTLTPEQLKEYEKLSGEKIKPTDNPLVFIITSKNGKDYKQYARNILNRISSFKLKNAENKAKEKSLFNLNLEKQLKKDWGSVVCSMTKDEINQLKSIAKKNEITLNRLIRVALLKVIESYK